MTYLLPVHNDYSKVSFDASKTTFDDSIRDFVRKWIPLKLRDYSQIINTTTIVAIAAITCAAIACAPKTIAFGCIAASVVIYNRFAKKLDSRVRDLLATRWIQKNIEYLSAPNLNEKDLKPLVKGFSENANNLRDMKYKLDALHDRLDLKKILLEKHKKISTERRLLNKKLNYLETKLSLEGLEESPLKEITESTLGRLSNGLDLSQVDLLLEDLTPLMHDFEKHICNLKSIKEDLEGLEEGLPLKNTLREGYTKILASVEDLHKKLGALQTNRSFFKEHGTLLTKIANTFLKIDQRLTGEMTACHNFMFYSLTGAALIKLGRFLEAASKANWADAVIINQSIGDPYLIMGVGGMCVAYAVKSVFNLIAHRNDEAKKQIELATITQEETTKLKLLLKPEEMVAT